MLDRSERPSPGPLGGRKADAGLQGDAGYVAAGCKGLGFRALATEARPEVPTTQIGSGPSRPTMPSCQSRPFAEMANRNGASEISTEP